MISAVKKPKVEPPTPAKRSITFIMLIGPAQIRTEISIFVREGLFPFELQGHRVVLPARIELATYPCEGVALSTELREHNSFQLLPSDQILAHSKLLCFDGLEFAWLCHPFSTRLVLRVVDVTWSQAHSKPAVKTNVLLKLFNRIAFSKSSCATNF